MDAPAIQYARTSDGVNIAFWTMGIGPALEYVRTTTYTHVQLEWQQDLPGRLYDALAANRTLITFDRRGAGLSDRRVSELTLETFTLDLDAVVGHLGLERFVLMGQSFGMMVSTIYALRHPERVSALISLNGVMSGSAFQQLPRNRAFRAMREGVDFDTYVDTIAAISGDPRRNDVRRASITAEGHQAFVDAAKTLDVTDLVSQLKLPVLLLYPADGPYAPDEGAFAREMATRIPGARLVAVPWEPREAYRERVVSAVDAFLSAAPADEESHAPSGTAVILFLDIAGSTALTTRLGDAAYREKERELDGELRQAIRDRGGSPVEGKVLGDGVMAVFASASNAIDAALACGERGRHAGLPLHVGIHAGDVIREGNNVHGGAVQVAARIADASAPGEVWVSDIVRGLARTSAGVSFDDRGERELKGVSEPLRVFAVKSSG